MSIAASTPCKTLALLGGEPVARFENFPRDKTGVPTEAVSAVANTIASGNWSMFTSDEVVLFEKAFAEHVGARHAVLVNSCTTAIHAALVACGIGEGSLVAVPAFTYVGTCMPAVALGAKLVLVDIDVETQSICPESLRRAMTRHRISAVVHAHLFGRISGADTIARIAADHGAHYVSDAAQFLGTKLQTANLAVLGPCCFSFGDSKLLRLGEGGAVVTNSDDVAERVRRFRHEGEAWLRVGKSRVEGFDPTPSDVLSHLATVSPGLNYRPVAAIAALGRVMLRYLPNTLAQIRSNALTLTNQLRSLPGLTLPPDEGRSWWTYPVILDPTRFERNVCLACLLAERIPAGVHFPRTISAHPLLAEHIANPSDQPTGAQYFSENHIVLPIYAALSENHMQQFADALQKVLGSIDGKCPALRDASSKFLNSRVVDALSSGLFFFLRDPVEPE